MKIKSFLTFIAFLAIQTAVLAQKWVLNSAKTNYEKYVQLKDAGTASEYEWKNNEFTGGLGV